MITLNELCSIADRSGNANAALQQACALPRSTADMNPLPAPDGESGFDSSWEALLSGAPVELQG